MRVSVFAGEGTTNEMSGCWNVKRLLGKSSCHSIIGHCTARREMEDFDGELILNNKAKWNNLVTNTGHFASRFPFGGKTIEDAGMS